MGGRLAPLDSWILASVDEKTWSYGCHEDTKKYVLFSTTSVLGSWDQNLAIQCLAAWLGVYGPATYLSVIVHKGHGDFSVGSDICGVEGGADPALLDICEPALCALDIGIQRHYLGGGWSTGKR